MGTLNSWDVVDANNNAAPPDGWPENTMQYSEVNNTGRAVQGTLKRYFADVGGSLNAGGVADAYTLTLNETGYSAYFDGMHFACSIPATNTGASTIDVNGIGAQAITDRAGNALTAGELQSGGIYEFRYDGTNFQLMGTVTGTVSIPTGTFTNNNNVDLVDTDVALRVGAADPDASPHLELSDFELQSKGDATTTALLAIQPLGGDTRIGAQSGTGAVDLYHNGVIRMDTQNGGVVAVKSDGNTDAEVRRIDFEHQDATLRALVGHQSSADFLIQNRIDSGEVLLSGFNSGSNARTLVQGDPDADVDIFHPGSNGVALRTAASGITVLDANNINIEQIVMQEQGGTSHAIFTASAASVLLQAAAGSALIQMSKGTNTVTCDASDVTLAHLGTDVAQTVTAANGGLQVNNLNTGAGFERVLTTSDLGGGAAAPQFDEQSSDTTVNNSTTLVNSQISFSNVPIGHYKIEGMILLRDVAVSGCGARLDWSVSGADPDSIQRVALKNFSGAGALSYDEQGLATDLFDGIPLVTGSGTSRVRLSGNIEFILASNSFTLQFAQNTAQVGDLDFEAGSWVSLIPCS